MKINEDYNCSEKNFIENNELEKILILSRHGLRCPLLNMSDISKENKIYALKEHEENPGKLTEKGLLLEIYFAQYIKKYLEKNKLLNKKEIIKTVYTNGFQRTRATGQAMALGIFPGELVVPTVKANIEEMDPNFNHEIRGRYEEFEKILSNSETLKLVMKLLPKVYFKLKDLINYEGKDGEIEDYLSNISLDTKRYFNPIGLLNLCVEIAGNLTLQYYEGVDINEMLDGRLKSLDELKEIINIREQYMKFKHENWEVANHMVNPILKCIYSDFFESETDVSIIVGHDCNIFALLTAMGINDYDLDDQIEYTPVGGKIFIELWKDKKNYEKKVRIKYVYQSTNQIRNCERLSLKNPPKEKIIDTPKLKKDEYGLYLYDDMNNFLKGLLEYDKKF